MRSDGFDDVQDVTEIDDIRRLLLRIGLEIRVLALGCQPVFPEQADVFTGSAAVNRGRCNLTG
jgi:hypothetical protein